jgi:O-antigen chain-terminating methyltransferase
LVLKKIGGTLLSESLQELREEEKENICKKLLMIICDLESFGVFHNDIRTWNIMLDSKNDPYLFDFGLSSFVEKENNLFAFAFLVNSLITNKVEETTYNKNYLPEFTENTLYKRYIAPVGTGQIKIFKDLLMSVQN